MGKSSRKNFAVFDFKEEDELVEPAAVRLIERIRSNGDDNPAIMKYEFLQNVSQGEIETNNASYIDLDESDIKHKCSNSGLHDLSAPDRESATKQRLSGLDAVLISKSTSHEPIAHTSQDTFESGNTFSGQTPITVRALSPGIPPTGDKRSNCTFLDPSSDNESVGVISDDDGRMKGSFLPKFSDNVENEGEPASDHCFSGCAMVNINSVVIYPDFVKYGPYVDAYSTESLLIFSCSFIKLEGLTACGNKESFTFEWAIGDVMEIESQWCEMAETALVKLRLNESDAAGAENADDTSGVMELIFGVSDCQWSEKQEMITSLHARYRSIWNVVLGSNEAFEEFIYPKGDPDAVSISKRDVELLQPETFINDTIIDFYIKYLKNKIKPEDKHRFHFFNSFFFRKLADLDKDPSSASEGREAFLRVHKWTRKVDLFGKDYIFIPVNFNLHWSLIVICHAGEVVNFKDEDIDKSPKVPCILHMDSIKGSHQGLKNVIQSYLWEEWKERQKETPEDVSAKFFNLRFVPLELPQQENLFDCGLFLLHYVDLFLEEAPVCFSPFKITKFSHFLTMHWFLPAEASFKRSLLKKMIYETLEEYSGKVPQPASSNKQCSFEFREDNENKNGVEILSKERSPKNICQSNSSSTAERGIEIKLLPISPRGPVQCSMNLGLVYRELFTSGATAGSSPEGHPRPSERIESFHKFKSAMPPIEEDSETGEQYVYSSSADCQALAGLTREVCRSSFFSKDDEPFESLLNLRISTRLEEHRKGGSSSNTSGCGSPSSSEKGADEDLEGPNQHNSLKLRAVSPQKIGCITECPASLSRRNLESHVVEDSQEVDGGELESYVVEDSQEVDDGNLESHVVEDSQEVDGGKLGSYVVEDSQEVDGGKLESYVVEDSQEVDDGNLESHIVEDSLEVDRLADSKEHGDPLSCFPENATASSHQHADFTKDIEVEISDLQFSIDVVPEPLKQPAAKRPRLTSSFSKEFEKQEAH
ncbi:probable ubiquitin-like-specific protease 2B isoform X2 [Macadamia integrifolia]|uniref:probable ubiquitin-like-specific protease 2B isoform X2 n=1 Tax=Macadamia integrifolia TaxID=60698 RepID=UPI001C4FAA1F|nr:probable ubiquitin-like-specific protease 2B isoform X2 [Macadamia integrifolia]